MAIKTSLPLKDHRLLGLEQNIDLSSGNVINSIGFLEASANRSHREFICDEHDDGDMTTTSAAETFLIGINEDSPIKTKLLLLFSSGLPMIVSYLLDLGGSFITLLFAGHFSIDGTNTTVIAGVSLANMFVNVTFFSILYGMASALETLASQHNGARQYEKVGIVFQRACLILLTTSIPIVALWFFADEIFELLGVERDVCDVMANYIFIRILCVPADIFNICSGCYLMAVGVTYPSMWMNISFNLFLIGTNSLFVFYFDMDYTCMAWAWVLSIYASIIVQINLSLRYEEVVRTSVQVFAQQPWFIHKDAWSEWKEFISLGLPGTVMICSEWWAYEFLVMMAALLGTEEVAAQAIIIQTSYLTYTIPLGFNVALSSIVGNALGAGKKELAVQMGKIALCSICIVEVVISMAILFGGSYFIRFVTDDVEVEEIAISVLPYLSMFAYVDGVQSMCSAMLTGAGRQYIGAIANVIAFYVIGLPMAWFFCFVMKFDIPGLMMGIYMGTLLQTIALLFLVLCRNDFLFTEADLENEIAEQAFLLQEGDKDDKDGLEMPFLSSSNLSEDIACPQ